VSRPEFHRPSPRRQARRSTVRRGIEASREAIREQYFGGARLLFSDARVVYLLLNDARSRAIARVFGISGQNSALVTMIALGIAAEATHRKVGRVLNAPGTPDTADTVIARPCCGRRCARSQDLGGTVPWHAGHRVGGGEHASSRAASNDARRQILSAPGSH